jgi:hypothetical protein
LNIGASAIVSFCFFASFVFVWLVISTVLLQSEAGKKTVFFASKQNIFCIIFASFRFETITNSVSRKTYFKRTEARLGESNEFSVIIEQKRKEVEREN